MELLSQNLNVNTLLLAVSLFFLRRLMKQIDGALERVEELRIGQRALEVRVAELEKAEGRV